MKIDNREVKHDVYGKRQDEIAFLPKKGETWFNWAPFLSVN